MQNSDVDVYSASPNHVEPGESDLPKEVFHPELRAIMHRRSVLREGKPPATPFEPAEGVVPSTGLGLNGLAISGGGIRSATFSLGLMQALARAEVLADFDYMSTVSGGGYSGSCLTWAMYGKPQTKDEDHLEFIATLGVGKDSFPIGTDDPREETPTPGKELSKDGALKRRKLLKYLREHGKYLTPGNGITALSGLGVFCRGVLLNLLVWVTLAACLFYFVRFAGWQSAFESWLPTFALLGFGAVASIVYSLGTFFSFGKSARYTYFRRGFERWSGMFFMLLFAAIGVGTLGWVHGAVSEAVEGVSAGMIASGAATGLWTYIRSASEKSEQKSVLPIGLVATLASLLLLYGGFLGAYSLADHGLAAFPGDPFWAFVALGVALVTGWIVNINYISLHRFYRDRLMETFLPGIDRAIEGLTGPSPEADSARLSTMWDHENPRGPYHIINTNAVLVDSKRRTQRTRGGDNFILSPFFCGSSVTGWRRTDKFEAGKMTLATAMAISAAAANPNSAVAGEGMTRNKFVSILMALLNLRLGFWTHPPRRKRHFWFVPNHFWPGGAYELGGLFRETSMWLQLTDGGHFENLALYEMVRRRLKLIVVVDGGADPDFVFEDLQNACRRIATDFGARIEFPKDDSLSRLTYAEWTRQNYSAWTREEMAEVVSAGGARAGFTGFPKQAAVAEKGWIHGKIHYSGGTEQGDIIYVKTTMVKGLSITTKGYKDKHPEFPDQATSDQFFDPAQFAAYRELGYVIGADAAKKIKELVRPAPQPEM